MRHQIKSCQIIKDGNVYENIENLNCTGTQNNSRMTLVENADFNLVPWSNLWNLPLRNNKIKIKLYCRVFEQHNFEVKGCFLRK